MLGIQREIVAAAALFTILAISFGINPWSSDGSAPDLMKAIRQADANYQLKDDAAGSTRSRCAEGYVWREAVPNDHACVTPQIRERVRLDNRLTELRRDPHQVYGPNTCLPGYVWREAVPEDTVCVTPAVKKRVRQDKQQQLGPASK